MWEWLLFAAVFGGIMVAGWLVIRAAIRSPNDSKGDDWRQH
jgi:hypothetical protein